MLALLGGTLPQAAGAARGGSGLAGWGLGGGGGTWASWSRAASAQAARVTAWQEGRNRAQESASKTVSKTEGRGKQRSFAFAGGGGRGPGAGTAPRCGRCRSPRCAPSWSGTPATHPPTRPPAQLATITFRNTSPRDHQAAVAEAVKRRRCEPKFAGRRAGGRAAVSTRRGGGGGAGGLGARQRNRAAPPFRRPAHGGAGSARRGRGDKRVGGRGGRGGDGVPPRASSLRPRSPWPRVCGLRRQ